VEKEGKFWLVRDKRRFLLAVMEELAGDAHMSYQNCENGVCFISVANKRLRP